MNACCLGVRRARRRDLLFVRAAVGSKEDFIKEFQAGFGQRASSLEHGTMMRPKGLPIPSPWAILMTVPKNQHNLALMQRALKRFKFSRTATILVRVDHKNIG